MTATTRPAGRGPAPAARTGDGYTIHDLVRLTGLTSRTLRHYDHVGLLSPCGTGAGGVRLYDGAALVRLQRIMLLRELGLSLGQIGQVLSGEREPLAALRTHLGLLASQAARIEAMSGSVRATIARLEKGEGLVADEMFAGFDHAQYKDEVIERWGKDAYAKSDTWYRSLSEEDKRGFAQEAADITRGFAAAKAEGRDPGDEDVQALTARHYRFIATAWGSVQPTAEQFTGLGEMYVADSRFRKNYDSLTEGTAELVRGAMAIYAQAHLS